MPYVLTWIKASVCYCHDKTVIIKDVGKHITTKVILLSVYFCSWETFLLITHDFFFSEDVKLPVALIMYTSSRAAHVKSMVTLTEYLRNCCFVEALLDQLDIPNSETKV